MWIKAKEASRLANIECDDVQSLSLSLSLSLAAGHPPVPATTAHPKSVSRAACLATHWTELDTITDITSLHITYQVGILYVVQHIITSQHFSSFNEFVKLDQLTRCYTK